MAEPKWILFAEAVALLTKFYLVPKRAVQRLLEGLSSGDVDWRCRELKGWQPPYPGQGDPLFWRGGNGWQTRLGRETSSAQRMRPTRLPNGRHGYAGYTAYGIEVPLAAVLALRPEGASAAIPTRWHKRPSKVDLKAAMGEIERDYPPGTRPPAFEIIWVRMKALLGPDVTRQIARDALDDFPHLRRPSGRPSKLSRSQK
jgi:hypothetical protein